MITQNLFQKNATQIQSAGVALTLKKRLGRRKGSTGLTYSLGPRFVQLEDRYELDYVSFQNTFNSAAVAAAAAAAAAAVLEPGVGTGREGGGGTGGVLAEITTTITITITTQLVPVVTADVYNGSGCAGMLE